MDMNKPWLKIGVFFLFVQFNPARQAGQSIKINCTADTTHSVKVINLVQLFLQKKSTSAQATNSATDSKLRFKFWQGQYLSLIFFENVPKMRMSEKCHNNNKNNNNSNNNNSSGNPLTSRRTYGDKNTRSRNLRLTLCLKTWKNELLLTCLVAR